LSHAARFKAGSQESISQLPIDEPAYVKEYLLGRTTNWLSSIRYWRSKEILD
jgi:hypothetical protein